MDLFLALVALAILGYCVWPKAKKAADVNEDGKVNVDDAKAVAVKVEDAIVAEAKEAAAEISKTVEEVAVKVEEEIKEEVKKVVAKAKKTTEKAKTAVVRNTKKKN